MNRKLYIVAYDVREPSRLAAALRVVKSFACGGQKSAYECWLSDAECDELATGLASVLDLTVDSVAMIPLELRRPMTALGAALAPVDPTYFYIG